ncbi:DNA gyrase subunit A [Atopostipes suicloacalis DSM 15692]|uniref:DNA gyrase subunit A n=1 Tax=Atopostipes suicloacalis DSM 15692 TaxID=1121025 RepID=A0A1M4X6N3_9LACT|nr:DNA gyrase subunit A [Atopostipes suicloacalis]SHE89158.1 DNA gyrase subunit A [Atopostipes suicloacalis DSM 15692]
MADNRSGIEEIQLSQEMQKSFLDYSMSVIVSRALPDVRDGLKPVHRRILHGMNELGITPDKSYKKSARIVGDVMGKYHPHGDSAIYDSMVRMAQDFSYRYPLVDGHGNFGSVDGDSAAAMRYTEARMSKIALQLLRDINKNTVDFRENYDGSESEPTVLPAKFPNLLVNGASGIAVGMATNIPTHNLRETIEACRVILRNPEATTAELMEVLPGPDFPTGGIVLGKSGIRKAYDTGRGSIQVRAKTRIEEKNGRERIIVDEIPYLVNKAKLVEKIAELARDKRIEGITALNDESDRDGMRIAIDIRRDASAAVILNNLFKMTSLQTSFGFNMLAIVNGVPRTLSLKEILVYYLDHQREVIRRRTQFDKEKAEARAHILEGLRTALDHIDAIISIIRGSETGAIAKEALMTQYKLSDRQAQAILDMRMVRLTGLEREKIEEEYQNLKELISDLKDILANPERIDSIIEEEMIEIADKHGDDRRTELMVGEALSIEDEDLIEEEEVVITLSHNGYMKRMPITDFKTQNRGGRGVKGMGTNDDDFVETILSTSTHDMVLFFTNAGKVYKAKAYEIPEYSRTAKGIPALNFLGIENDERIQAVVSLNEKPEEGEQLFFATKQGTVKRTEAIEFQNIRTSGLIAINLNEGDELISVRLTDGQQNIIIGTKDGYAASFSEQDVRSMGRNATGVRGINLREGDYVVGVGILAENSYVLAISENGYGKATEAVQYAIRRRGGKGVKTFKITERNGSLVGLSTIIGDEDILLITNEGIIIRFEADNISKTGRDTQGVRLMRLDEEQFISTLCVVDPTETDEEEDDEQKDTTSSDKLPSSEELSERPQEVDELLQRAEEDPEEDLNTPEDE